MLKSFHVCVRENAIFVFLFRFEMSADIVTVRAVELNSKREIKAMVPTWRQNEDLAHLYTYSQAYRDYKLALLADGSH